MAIVNRVKDRKRANTKNILDDQKKKSKKTARVTKRLEYYDISDKKRKRNIKRKKRMEKKGTWDTRKEKVVKRKIKDQTLPGMKNWKKPMNRQEKQRLLAQIKLNTTPTIK
tara:strand:+ start:175 stop:507 length:333 start_codon:yes stop_codon:yes gene_type:complete